MYKQEIDTTRMSELLRTVSTLDKVNECPSTLNVAFLRNITIEPIVPFMKFLCYRENIRVNIYMSGYDNMMQDVMNDGSALYGHAPEIVIACVKMETFAEKLTMSFSQMSQQDIDEEAGRVLGFIRDMICEIRKRCDALILVHNFEAPAYPVLGIYDYQDRCRQINTFRRMNLELLEVVKKYEGVYVVDVEALKSVLGYERYFDSRYWHIGKAPYTREALKEVAKEYMKFIRAMKGKSRKCLVVDCDNTLWGGIVGEDGIGKIRIGKSYPGSAYREFQQAILNLHSRGILLAICSKNNERDVLDVFEQHPEMILRKEHFLVMKINWNDKVSNLREIADELNIGLDSIVFMDDSEFEINMVREILPDILSIQLPKDPSEYRDLTNSMGVFDTLSFSDEDRRRNEMYKSEMNRKKVENNFKSLEDYFRHLEMEVLIRGADELSVSRISQLTQRTNQFNLTTKRYHDTEIRSMIESSDHEVYYLRLKDRFGDSGIVGAVILRHEDDACVIDTFLLSCRVLGRGVEDALLKFCVSRGRAKRCRHIIGMYRATKKNHIAKDFYQKHHFHLDNEDEAVSTYAMEVSEDQLSFPEYFKAINIE